MSTIDVLAAAIQHHQAGRLQAAEQAYRQVLALEPNQSDAWHYLGLIAYQVGQHAVAVQYMAHAVGLKPGVAGYHSNLGLAHRALARLDEAAACWRRALELEPDHAEAQTTWACSPPGTRKAGRSPALAAAGRPAEAGLCRSAESLGIALRDLGKLDEAIACFQRLLQQRPDYADAHNSLGNALWKQQKEEPLRVIGGPSR